MKIQLFIFALGYVIDRKTAHSVNLYLNIIFSINIAIRVINYSVNLPVCRNEAHSPIETE